MPSGQNQFTKARRDRHFDETREKIKTTQIIKRLYECVEGKLELSPQQVAAAKTLLAKTLPDLQSAELNVETTERQVVSDKPLTEDEWSKRYEDSMGATNGSAKSLN